MLFRKWFYIVHVFGDSMLPKYKHKDRLLAIKYSSLISLRKRMIVILEIPNQQHYTRQEIKSFLERNPEMYEHIAVDQDQTPQLAVKRVVALPQETFLAFLSDIHEKAITDEIIALYGEDGRKDWDISSDHYFLSGDNKGTDSRVWGPVHIDQIKGVVLMKLGGPTRV